MAPTRSFALGLTGYPLGHSLSPRLHSAALEGCGLVGEYRLYPVAPGAGRDRELGELMARLRSGELDGLNVTIPHKQSVIPFLDSLTPVAAAIGAVNTIYLESGRLTGDNTDAAGFLSDLNRTLSLGKASPTLETEIALILGAGGSARAVVYALASAGWRVTVAARRPDQARELVASLSEESLYGQQLSVISMDRLSISNLKPEFSLIVNATPVGMTPQVETSPWPEGLSFPDSAAVYDLVYNPAETRLVREARGAGLRAANGIGMLVEQAALAFERWTGEPASRDAMQLAVAALDWEQR